MLPVVMRAAKYAIPASSTRFSAISAGRHELVEGKMRSRNVLREFNSYDEALAAYRGPDYSRARPLRAPHSACDFLIVEGYDGPQPERIGTPPAPAALKGYWIGHVDVTDPEAAADAIVAEIARSVPA